MCLAVLALLLARYRRFRYSKMLGSFCLVWLWIWSMPVLSHRLCGAIENQFPQISIENVPHAQALVVLGGAISPPSGQSIEINLQAAADRVWYASRLFHAGKVPLLVLSGGGDLTHDNYSEAHAMALFLLDLGVPSESMLQEESSRNSRENAGFSAEMLRARGINHILLVTSALHMPRALTLFTDQGLVVEPVPTDFQGRLSQQGVLAWLPDAGALETSGRAMKEVVGKFVGW